MHTHTHTTQELTRQAETDTCTLQHRKHASHNNSQACRKQFSAGLAARAQAGLHAVHSITVGMGLKLPAATSCQAYLGVCVYCKALNR